MYSNYDFVEVNNGLNPLNILTFCIYDALMEP